jgi:PKD domain
MTSLGFDCGLGTTSAVINGTGYPVAPSENGVFENLTRCDWIGDVALTGGGTADGTNEPLVADQDETFSTVSGAIGGGFTADVIYLQNATSTMNGFDITVSWNPSILRAAQIDQTGTNWGALSPFTVVQSTDNTVGHLHLLQVAFQNFGLNFTLFKIRFDVIGIGSTGLTMSNDLILNPGLVVHQTNQGSFNSERFYDPGQTLNWQATFTNSTPIKAGGPNHFTATVSGGTAPYNYAWMFNGTNTTPFAPLNTSSITASVTRTMPVDNTVSGNRMRLRITDSASPTQHVIEVVQLLPLTLGSIQGPNSLPFNTGGTWSGIWLGGVPNYAVNWRFCPGSATSIQVCASPTVSVSSQAGQNSTKTVNGYHFSGVYNITMQVKTSSSGSVQSVAGTENYLLNVTGGTPYFTVQVNGDQNATVGFPAKISATVAYSTGIPFNALGVVFRSSQFIYTFSFGDGTQPVVVTTGPTASITHTFGSAASYPITITVRDVQTPSRIQEAGFATVVVGTSVTGSFSVSTTSPATGQSVSFTPSFSGGTPPYTYFWDYGDGSTDTGSSPSHQFAKSGNYTITVTVTDAVGRKYTTTHTVSVSQAIAPPPPPADNSLLIYGGVGVAIVAIGAALLLLRRKRARRSPVA